MRKIRRQIYCWNGWQCNALSCDVSLILILPGPMWWWCCGVLSACWKTRVNTSAAALSLDQDGAGHYNEWSWPLIHSIWQLTQTWCCLTQYYSLTHTTHLSLHTHEGVMFEEYMEEAVGCGVGHWPLQLTLFTSLFRWTPHFLLHQLARQ